MLTGREWKGIGIVIVCFARVLGWDSVGWIYSGDVGRTYRLLEYVCTILDRNFAHTSSKLAVSAMRSYLLRVRREIATEYHR